jgi:flagellin
MGLRINANLPGLTALKQLRDLDAAFGRSIERLSTGVELNRASEAPARMAVADSLRAQIAALRQTIENAGRASNLVATADAALGEVEEILQGIQRSLVFAQNTGAAGPEQILAEQDSVDQSLEAIRRLSATTRFGGLSLLNGDSAIRVESFDTANILEIRPLRAQFNAVTSTTTFSIEVTASATQATALLGSSAAPGAVAASGGTVTLRLTGPRGLAEIALASGATAVDLAGAINLLREQTAVYASGAFMFTEAFGSQAKIRIEQIGGTGRFAGGPVGAPGLAAGVGDIAVVSGSDAVGTFLGNSFAAQGNTVILDTPFLRADILLNPTTNQDPVRGAGSTGTFFFTLRFSGLRFQIDEADPRPHVGLRAVDPPTLGRPTTVIGGRTLGGVLSTLQTGGANNLLVNPGDGFLIARESLDLIAATRGFLGSIAAQELEPSRRRQAVSEENLVASESLLRDADFAEQSAILARTQALFESTLAVLGQANGLGAQVLELLNGP